MKKTIWKFSTLIDGKFIDKFTIKMPKSAEILCVQTDEKNNHPTIWALVDPEAEEEERDFELYGTAPAIPLDMGLKENTSEPTNTSGVNLLAIFLNELIK